jgi:hypothetical protein
MWWGTGQFNAYTRRALGVTSENWWALGWYQCFVFFGEFLQLGDKEKGLANPTKAFLGVVF